MVIAAISAAVAEQSRRAAADGETIFAANLADYSLRLGEWSAECLEDAKMVEIDACISAMPSESIEVLMKTASRR